MISSSKVPDGRGDNEQLQMGASRAVSDDDVKTMESTIEFEKVAKALPTLNTITCQAQQSNNRKQSAITLSPRPLPKCYEKIARRKFSSLAFHLHQITTLDAISATLPCDISSLSEASATAVYLSALLSALTRYIATSSEPIVSNPRIPNSRDTKKKVSRNRLKAIRNEEDVIGLAVNDLIVPETSQSATSIFASNLDDTTSGNRHEAVIAALTSFTSLLALTVQAVSPAVVNFKADDILDATLSAYHHASGYVTVAHHANACIVATLSVLSSSALSFPKSQASFLYLLRHAGDADTAFRENSVRALLALANCPRGNVITWTTSGSAVTFMLARLQACVSAVSLPHLSDARRKEIVSALAHLLAAMEAYAPFLRVADFSRALAEVINVAAMEDSFTTLAYASLATLFSIQGKGGSELAEIPLLPQSNLGKLVHAVVSQGVADDCDDALAVAYASCVAAGAKAYALSFGHATMPFEFVTLSVRRVVAVIDPSRGSSTITRDLCKALMSLLEDDAYTRKASVLTLLQKFISEEFRPIWREVVPVLRTYLEGGIRSADKGMTEGAQSLVESVVRKRAEALHVRDEKMRNMAESVLKAVSRGGGVTIILSVCTIKYEVKDHVTNSWMLGVLRQNIDGAALATFEKYLLPVAQKLHAVAREREAEKRVVEAKNIDIYEMQIWALLPGFCTKPVDLLHDGVLTLAFQKIYECLSRTGIGANLQVFGVAALRQLSLSISSLSLADPTCKDKVMAFASRFKKLFPKLLEIVATISDDLRVGLLRGVTAACEAANDSGVISNLLRKSIKQLLEMQIQTSDENGIGDDMCNTRNVDKERRQHSSADVAVAIMESGVVPAGSSEIGFLEKAMMPFFEDRKASSLQKKAYRVTGMLISSGALTKDEEAFSALVRKVADASGTLAAGAKAARLVWIVAVLEQHRGRPVSGRVAFLEGASDLFLSEIILSTRDSSEKCRAAAFHALVSLARAWHSAHGIEEVKGLEKIFLGVSSGLGGKSSAMIAGTLGSLGKLLETFRYEIESNSCLREVVDSLFATEIDMSADRIMQDSDESVRTATQPGPIAILLRHGSVEVQRSALGVVKVATKCCCVPEGRLLKLVPGILPGLLHVSAGSKKQETRLKVRLVLERLLRKCGIEQLQGMFPVEHRKLLAAVRKQLTRDLAKKQANRDRKFSEREGLDSKPAMVVEEDDSDDSDVEAQLLNGGKSLNSGVAGEDGVDDVVDLLESKSGGALLRKAGVEVKYEGFVNRKKKPEKAIRYTDDGKPIFVESDDESAGAEAGSLDSDDDEDRSDGRDGASVKNQKDAKIIIGKRRFGDIDGGGEASRAKKFRGSFGLEFRGKRAGGDVKRAGKPDPFAYVPLGAGLFSAGSRSSHRGKSGHSSALAALHSGVHGSHRSRRKTGGRRSGIPGRR